MVTQGDEGGVRGPMVNQVQQNLLVVYSQVVHVLLRRRWMWKRRRRRQRRRDTAVRYQCPTSPDWHYSMGLQLTGPEVGVGAHHAHDQGAGYPPGQRGALWERPSDLQRHRSIRGTTSNQTCGLKDKLHKSHSSCTFSLQLTLH